MSLSQYKIPSKSTNQFNRCTHLRSLNVRNYGIVEATRLNNMASRSPSTSSPPYKISSKSTNQFRSCTHLRSLNVRHFGAIDVTFNVITSIQNFIQIHQSVQKLHPPQKFKRPPLLMVEATGLSSMESRSSSMSSLPYKMSFKSTNQFKFAPTSEV
jgi:ribosomal protein S10